MIYLFTSLSFAQWQNINPGFGIDYYSITMPDSNEIWAVGSDKIIHSSDRGNSWGIQFQSGNDLYAIKFIDNSFGWAVGNYIYFGRAYRTTNGGENWDQINILGYHLRAVEFTDYSNGWVAGFDEIQKTTNGGLDWTTVPSGTGKYLFDISFISNLEGWAVGGDMGTGGGVIIKTVDGGNNWSINKDSIDSRLEGIFFIDQNNGWVVGGGNEPKILKTTDGGITWVEKICPKYADLYKVKFVNSSLGWIVGSYGTILQTVDGGENWEIQGSGLTSNYLNDIDMYDSLKGAICGFGDNILVTNNGGITEVVRYEPSLNDYKLFDNYPNPFNPTTKINFTIPKSEIVTLKVYDILGKEVRTLLNEYKNAGTSEIEFYSNGLASGIYFYRIVSGNYSEIKKMILLR